MSLLDGDENFLVLNCSLIGKESMTLMEIDISMENQLMDC